MIHLAVFSALFVPYKGGYVHSLQGLLTHLAKENVQILVITSQIQKEDALEETTAYCRILRIPCWNPRALNQSFPIPKPTFTTVKQLWRILTNEPIDIISTQTRFFIHAWLGLFFSFIRRKPLIHTERGGYHPQLASPILKKFALLIDHTLGTWVVRHAIVAIGVSQAATDFCKHLGARSAVRIPNGIDIEDWRRPPSIKDDSPLPHDAIVITYVGRMIQGKGVQDLVEAFANLNNPRVQLLLAGDGPYRLELQRRIYEKKIERVHFLGECSIKKIHAILHRTQIFVNPSYSEGLPRSVLEAAAVGVPIIATNVGGTFELFPRNALDYLLPPRNIPKLASALEDLIHSPEKREKIGKAFSQHIADHFSWKPIVESYLSTIQKMTPHKERRF